MPLTPLTFRKQVILTKNGKNDDSQSTHKKNKGLRFSEPGSWRKWRKWRVSLRQNQGLPKTGFSPPWNPDFYAMRAVFIGGGGGLPCIELPGLSNSQRFRDAQVGMYRTYFLLWRIVRNVHADIGRPGGGEHTSKVSELQIHPNLHNPVWVGRTAVIPSERVQIWVCLFLYGWYCPGVRLQIWVCLICAIFRPAQTGLCKFGSGFGAHWKGGHLKIVFRHDFSQDESIFCSASFCEFLFLLQESLGPFGPEVSTLFWQVFCQTCSKTWDLPLEAFAIWKRSNILRLRVFGTLTPSAPHHRRTLQWVVGVYIRYFRNPCDRDPPTEISETLNSLKIP